jgi:hypothetical protein
MLRMDGEGTQGTGASVTLHLSPMEKVGTGRKIGSG